MSIITWNNGLRHIPTRYVHSSVSPTSCHMDQLATSSSTLSHRSDVESLSSPMMARRPDRDTSSSSSSTSGTALLMPCISSCPVIPVSSPNRFGSSFLRTTAPPGFRAAPVDSSRGAIPSLTPVTHPELMPPNSRVQRTSPGSEQWVAHQFNEQTSDVTTNLLTASPWTSRSPLNINGHGLGTMVNA